ncbi:hypothetical protein KM043_012740 [Ampulex compressa]|nr:hypothetical protein KM043_012740 [Ampulex compressa]
MFSSRLMDFHPNIQYSPPSKPSFPPAARYDNSSRTDRARENSSIAAQFAASSEQSPHIFDHREVSNIGPRGISRFGRRYRPLSCLQEKFRALIAEHSRGLDEIRSYLQCKFKRAEIYSCGPVQAFMLMGPQTYVHRPLEGAAHLESQALECHVVKAARVQKLEGAR